MSNRLSVIESIFQKTKPLFDEGYRQRPGIQSNDKLKTESKTSFRDLVTYYDKKIESVIREEIEKHFSGESILGEEGAAGGQLTPAQAQEEHPQCMWIVDPIDGTTNFARSYPFFCSTISWATHQGAGKYQIEVAATWNPVANELFTAQLGQGAQLNGQTMKCTANAEPHAALLATGFASERSQRNNRAFELFTELTRSTLGVRRDGSAALDLAYVACGRIDSYWEWGLSPWDLAAGALLVSEAGGKISHHDNSEWSLFSGEILSSNGPLHDWLVQAINS